MNSDLQSAIHDELIYQLQSALGQYTELIT